MSDKPTSEGAPKPWSELRLDDHVRRFLDGSLPHEEWAPHRSHLATTVWHLRRYPAPEALDRMRQAIQHWNRLHGFSDRYHETVTCFYVKIIALKLAELDVGQTTSELANDVIDSLGLDETTRWEMWSEYYSDPKSLIASDEARRTWVAPDLKALE